MSDKNDLKILKLWDTDYQTTFTKKFATRKPYEAPNPFHISSFIPGTIRDIKVKVGQVLKKGGFS